MLPFVSTKLLFFFYCWTLQSRTRAFITSGHFVKIQFACSQTLQRTVVTRASQNNPNDNETPEERQARMDLVRKIQATFYAPSSSKEETDDGVLGTAVAASDGENSRWLQTDPNDPTIMYNVPVWRVQWTELIGYQNVLNVHVPHYTHMFRTLLLQHPKPWYFGHVFLPGGSDYLGSPDYFLPEQEDRPEINFRQWNIWNDNLKWQ